MPSLRNLERQVTDAIHRQFSKRSASEDELLEDIRAIFDAESARAETPARESRSPASEAPSDNEEEDNSNEDTDEPPPPRPRSQNSEAGNAAAALLAELRPLLAIPQDRGKRLPLKAPDLYDGSFDTFRTWWEKTREYLNTNKPCLPTDKIRIQTVGSLLKGNALTWYQTRKRTMKAKHRKDNWQAFKAAFAERFTDHMEGQRDWCRLRELEYKNDIQTYLAQVEEINSRVGASGEPFREIIMDAITPAMGRSIYRRYGYIPDDDAELLRAVRQAGIVEEKIQLAAAQRKGKNKDVKEKDKDKDKEKEKEKNKNKNKESNKEGGKEGGKESGKSTGKTGRTGAAGGGKQKSKGSTKDFATLERIWPTLLDAFKDVDQASIDKYKEEGKDCIRCGYDGHRSIHCYRRKNADGIDLPPAPKKPAGDKAATNALKRQPEEKEPDSPEPSSKKAKIAAAGEAAGRIKKSWYCQTDSDSDSDF